ncbi:LytR/AlgR family response regulator transcription factor [Flavobacterium proteolyticum]|uniref:Response regulator transcription factor n=1 Tax=Flavobacterium proteolyticum TaxID=2911683 RepID=A0ABR9WRZ5_9FLAO|nr:LytTR family DNA-binding domain-containing protein [Flavobacterium proteolyticum]MBE9576533.1 response regulator transcription factor [Flavobacterium proteolyticum]
MEINAIIIDDEVRARVSLQLLLEEYCPNIKVIEQCETLAEGIKAINKFKPNIVFLDIEMPAHSGLELFDFFNEEEIDFSVIFTTAYSQYAIKAFKFSAIDYLLKPIHPEELVEAVKRFEKIKSQNIKILKENLDQNKLNKIAVPTGNSILFLETDQILYVKGEGSYCEIVLLNGEKIICSRYLKNFEDILSNYSNFLRVQKSYIANLNYVSVYNKSDGGNLEFNNKTCIPISLDKVDFIMEKITLIKR